ncbi:glycoside hydrolase family 3 N-terminal domain-containing protein [Nocardia sp. NPDC058499]|uniref:glycoside hydrolase family 3 N-terminal domain-containing protein n=1 Tax=Nocardia sp. NPDC058499 TaxID=3346530 RepID=UPI003665D27F
MPFDLPRIRSLRPDGLGHLSLSWLLDADLASFRAKLGEVQEHTRAVSPFGIGALIHAEGINGLVHAQGHQFPTAWGQASCWDPELVGKVGGIVGDQMYETGIHLAFAPVLDVARDLRWGRVHETYGEDPEVIARNGVAYISAIHGENRSVLAAAKHFAGYGASEGGLNQARAVIGRRELNDVYARPFARAIDEAGLSLVMNSYNEIDGVPAVSNRWLLTELLREQLGFDGLVVSDYDAVSMLLKIYHTASTPGKAAAQALSAGLDVELPGSEMFSALAGEVRAGSVDERHIDDAVLRVLAVKDQLGLVPNTSARPTRTPQVEDPDAVSRRLAEEAVVLLRNDGALPLTSFDGVAVVGSLADEVRIHFGAYTSASNEEQPLAIRMIMAGQVEGLDPAGTIFTDLFQLELPGIEAAFERRARELHPDMPTLIEALREVQPDLRYVDVGDPSLDADPLDEDALLAEVGPAQTVLVVVGERTAWVGNHTAGEGRTTTRNELPGNQTQLLRTLVEAGKTVVAIVISGRPLILEQALEGVDAALLAPLLGPHAAKSLTAVLAGEINPSGKLVSTFPRALGQVPMYHGHPFGSGYTHPTGTRHGYVDLAEQTPLFAFGHGLSYTTFELALRSVTIDGDSDSPTLTATATVTNTGAVAGETIVQLYVRDEVASIIRPARQLADFRRVRLDVGQAGTIELAAPISRFAYTMVDGRRRVEAGMLTALVGFASDDIRAEQGIGLPTDVDA